MTRESTLTASYVWTPRDRPGLDNKVAVGIFIGEKMIGQAYPDTYDIRPSRAGYGDDSKFYDAEEQRILDETFAAWFCDKLGL